MQHTKGGTRGRLGFRGRWVQHLGEERSGCNGEEGGGCCKNEGRRGAARVFEKMRERCPRCPWCETDGSQPNPPSKSRFRQMNTQMISFKWELHICGLRTSNGPQRFSHIHAPKINFWSTFFWDITVVAPSYALKSIFLVIYLWQ
jgi:hypothetical protein